MKKLSILFAALLATTLSFAADYEKVTAAPADWSGEYLIVYENSATEAYAFNGVDAEGDYTKEIITDNKITTTTAVSFKVAKNGEKYSILILGGKNDGKYLGHSGTKNGIKTADEAIDNIIEYNDKNKNTIIRNEEVATLQFNNAATNGNRFRYYTKLNQQQIQLYKKVAGVPVPATAIALDQTELEMEQYKYIKLVATLTPTDATTEVVWTSSNDKVATVANGLVTIVAAEGTATITATAGTVSATCEVTAKSATVLTCAEAAQKALSVSADNEVLAGGKYVIRGYVTALAGTPSTDFSTYGNYSVWMADAKDGGKVFEAYQVKPVDGKTVAKVGDYVEIVGDLTKYKTTPETVGKQNATIAFLADPTPQPAVSPYCQTEVGHLFAENADPNSYILLSIGSKNGKTIVRIDQDAAKNSAMFDYLQVTTLATAGADVAEGGEKAMAVEFDTPAADADGNITLEILWSTVAWPGRWMVQNVKVPATAECEHAVLVGPSTALDATVVAPKATKRLINGVLVIEKDNVLYNAQGIRL